MIPKCEKNIKENISIVKTVLLHQTHIKENKIQINLEKQTTHNTHATGKSPDFT